MEKSRISHDVHKFLEDSSTLVNLQIIMEALRQSKTQRDVIEILAPQIHIGTNSYNIYQSLYRGTRRDTPFQECLRNYIKWKKTLSQSYSQGGDNLNVPSLQLTAGFPQTQVGLEPIVTPGVHVVTRSHDTDQNTCYDSRRKSNKRRRTLGNLQNIMEALRQSKTQRDVIEILAPQIHIGTNSYNIYQSLYRGTRRDTPFQECLRNYIKWKKTLSQSYSQGGNNLNVPSLQLTARAPIIQVEVATVPVSQTQALAGFSVLKNSSSDASHYTFETRSSVVLQKLKEHSQTVSPDVESSVVIAYRDEGDGKSAFYDHYTFQEITGFASKISLPPSIRTSKMENYINSISCGLKFGDLMDSGKKIPSVTQKAHEEGLLIIPGRMRANEDDSVRNMHERKLTRQARLRGQPILAICAGSWLLWESFIKTSDKDGKSKSTDEKLLQNVTDHVSRRMMRPLKNGGIGYNQQVHRVSVVKDSILYGAVYSKEERNNPCDLLVNSVHSKAVSATYEQDVFLLSARGYSDENISLRIGKHQINPDDCIEAFEPCYGAPVLGVQWHPEAYYGNTSKTESEKNHQNLLKYMSQAGLAYQRKRATLKELDEYFKKSRF